MAQVKQRLCLGNIAPTSGGDVRGYNVNTEPLLPPDIVEVSNALEIKDYTVEGVDDAMGRYDGLVADLVSRGAERILLAGIPISAQLGRKRSLEIIEHTQQKFGVPGDVACEVAIAAMRHLGISKLAVGSRWADELNNALTRYFADADIEVVTITTRGQWAKEAFAMSMEMGVKFAFECGREAMRKAPQADGLFLPGGTWRPLPAVPILEEDFGKPVFTNTTTNVWRLMHEGLAPPVQGWGRLLANP